MPPAEFGTPFASNPQSFRLAMCPAQARADTLPLPVLKVTSIWICEMSTASFAFHWAVLSTYLMEFSVPPQSDIFCLLASLRVWGGRAAKLVAGIVAFGVSMASSVNGV